MCAPRARVASQGQAWKLVATLLVAVVAASPCAAEPRTSHLRRLLQTSGAANTGGQAAGTSAGSTDIVGAAQQAINSPATQQATNAASKQFISSAIGNLPVNSNDLNTLIQGVRATQTFSQYLATLGGAASKQTSLQSTMNSQNIAGLYKQQQTDDKFKVGSPSGSVYWTTGYEPVPAPLQAQTASFANAVAPSVNQLTQAMLQLIPSPPPPPPPPTVIQALAPLEEATTQRIADILTTSGQAAGNGRGATSANDGGTTSFQQQQALPTMSVPTTFTHDTWSSPAGRKLQQQQQNSGAQASWAPTVQQLQGSNTAGSSQQGTQWTPTPQIQQQQAAGTGNQAQTWVPTTNSQPQQQQAAWTPTANTQAQTWTPSNGNGQQLTWTPTNNNNQAQTWTPTNNNQQQQSWTPTNNNQQQPSWTPTNTNNQQQQQSWATTNQQAAAGQAQQQQQTQTVTAPQSPGVATSSSNAKSQWPGIPQVQQADGSWVPAQQTSVQSAQPAGNNQAAITSGQQSTAVAAKTQSTGTTAAQELANTVAPTPAPAPSSSGITFPPVTINGVNLPGWSLPVLSPAPPLGPVPALPPLPQAPQPQPLPGQPQGAPNTPVITSFQRVTNEQGAPVPLTTALSKQSALPQLQAIASGAAAQPQPAAAAATAAQSTQPGLPGFPPQAAPSIPNGNLVWVGLGGGSGQTTSTKT